MIEIPSIVRNPQTALRGQAASPCARFTFFHSQATNDLVLILFVIDYQINLVGTWRPEGYIHLFARLRNTRSQITIILIDTILQLPVHAGFELIIAIFDKVR